MSFAPYNHYLRKDENGDTYLTAYGDEEKYDSERTKNRILHYRRYGKKEDLLKQQGYIDNIDIYVNIVDETAPKFRKKWKQFNKNTEFWYWRKDNKLINMCFIKKVLTEKEIDFVITCTDKELDKLYNILESFKSGKVVYDKCV